MDVETSTPLKGVELSQDCNNNGTEEKSLNDTHSTNSENETLNLSLPDSFDDTFSALDGLPGYIHDENPEIRLLHAQLYESKQRVKNLQDEREHAIQFLHGNVQFLQQDIESITSHARSKRSLEEMVKLRIYQQVSDKKIEAEKMIQCATNATEITKQMQEKASNMELLCDQKLANMKDALNAAKDRQSEAIEQVTLLQSNIIDLKEKGRMFDDTAEKNRRLSDEVNRLRVAMEQTLVETESFATRDSEAQATIKDLQRTTQSFGMEKTFLEKEKCMLVERAERSEDAAKILETSLQDTVSKADNLTVKLSESNLKANTSHASNVTKQVKQARSDCEKEFSAYRTQMEGAFERECRMLREAKDEVVAQYERASSEIICLRECTTQKDARIVELECTLCDVRSDLKVKCIEASRFHLTNEKMEKDLVEYRSQLEMMGDELQAHKLAFKHLEKDSTFERQRLHDEIKRKEDQLELYYQSQVRDLKDTRPSAIPINHLHLLEKSSSLQNKCQGLEDQVKHLRQKLKRQIEKSRSYESKLTTAHIALQDSRQGERPYIQDGASNSLAESLRADNTALRNEHYRLSQDFSHLLTKYFDLVGKMERARSDEQHSEKGERSILRKKADLRPIHVPGDTDLLLKHAVHHATAAKGRLDKYNA